MSSKTKTTATKEEAKPGLVPKLRFSGFSNPWAFEPLSKVLKEHKLKNTEGRDVFSVSMEYGIVNQIELLGRSFAAADTSHYTIGRRYDVVYTKSPLKAFPFGIVKQCKFDGEVALSPLYGVFTPPNPHLGLMIEAYFESPNRSRDFLSPLCQKGAKNTLQITNTTFLSGRLPLPTEPAEQQKIAECLSSVDELMAAQARKVDALKTHKKGLMQQLFPREGETQPRLRFPEFQNAGEWEVKKLGDFADVAASGDLDSELFSPTKTEICCYPVYSNAVEQEGLYGYYSVPKYPANCVTITARGTLGVAFLRHTKFMGIGRLLVLNFNQGIDSRFMKDCWNHLAKIPQEVTSIPQLTAVTARVTLFPIPNLEEQQRIASCLSSLDALITAETQKHEALKTHKKGLMQQLFPSPEEVEA